MNNTYYNINVPITQVITSVITKFSINNLTITPFQQATMIINLFDDNDKLVNNKYLVMEGNEYENWNGSDDYLINWINQQLQSMQ